MAKFFRKFRNQFLKFFRYKTFIIERNSSVDKVFFMEFILSFYTLPDPENFFLETPDLNGYPSPPFRPPATAPRGGGIRAGYMGGAGHV
jgi:hypothetical protein